MSDRDSTPTTYEYQCLFGPGVGWRMFDIVVAIIFGTIALFGIDHGEIAFPFGLPAVIFGLRGLIGIGRTTGFSLDRDAGRVRAWTGWFMPMSGSWRSLGRYRDVVLTLASRSEGRTSITFYEIALDGAGPRISLAEISDVSEARRIATETAAFLGFDLIDATDFNPTRTAAHNVGRPIRDHRPMNSTPVVPVAESMPAHPFDFRDRDATPTVAVTPEPFVDEVEVVPVCRPSGTLIEIEEQGGAIQVRIPRRSVGQVMQFPLFLALILGGIMGVLAFGLGGLVSKHAFELKEHVIPATIITAGFATFGFLFGLLMELDTAFVSFELVADAEKLSVRKRGLIFGSTWEFPVDHILSLRGNGLGGLKIITPQQELLVTHGGTTSPEIEWVRSRLMSRLTAS